ncbi:flagellar hook protein FlgE [Gemmatimonadetes bacterium T265]|nr:flagellar hook protein FlgE [Gemmatimonadetes bacterium T265]
MLRSLFDGVSGLRNQQTRMDVIGNNIANVNTTAFKAGRVTFKEGFAQLLQGGSRPPGDQGGTNPIQIGLGSQIGSIDQMYTQGNLETTGNATDLAIQGDAMFVVRKGAQSSYTRSGNFQVDSDGKLVSPTNGFVVQGEMYKNGIAQDGVQDITIPFGQKVAAKATDKMALGGNLNASATQVPSGFDIASATDRASNPGSWTETSLTTYDSLGNQHDVKLQLWKTNANQWAWRLDPTSPTVSVPAMIGTADSAGAHHFSIPTAGSGTTVTVAGATTASGLQIDPKYISYDSATGDYKIDPSINVNGNELATINYSITPAPASGTTATDPSTWHGVNGGVLTFDQEGNLDPTRSDAPVLKFSVPGADDVNVKLDLGSGSSGLTQSATSSTAVLRDQDGYTAGTLQNYSIDRYGVINGSYSNGTTQPLGRIVLADFNNPAGMLKTGDNMFQESANSGGAVLGYALEGSQSQITAGALEMSNVDLAQEFTNMIIAQRAFQANGKVITTSDQMLQELMQIKQ